MNIHLETLESDITRAVATALEEDIRSGDITAELIPAEKRDTAEIITREDCCVCGLAWVNEVFAQLGDVEPIQWHVSDGDYVLANAPLATLKGNTRRLLTGERSALNFLQTLSGTATKAYHYAQKLGPNSTIKLLDTRKTLPGLRTAQKYAVATGGCHNHRIGLFDAYLIKENHIAACGSIAKAIATARKLHPEKPVEIEVESLDELLQALDAKADIVMLDNFSHVMLMAAMDFDKGETKYELSGNLTIDNIAAASDYNVDYVSFGALTKSVEAVDLSFRVIS